MGTRQYDRLLACAHKIRALAQAGPEMDLMSLTSERARWTVRVLTGEDFKRVYTPSDLSEIPFSSRTLLEGLIGHGIMAPGDTAELIAMLRKVSSSTAFHDRILEALFSQQKIRDIKHLIPSKWKLGWIACECSLSDDMNVQNWPLSFVEGPRTSNPI